MEKHCVLRQTLNSIPTQRRHRTGKERFVLRCEKYISGRKDQPAREESLYSWTIRRHLSRWLLSLTHIVCRCRRCAERVLFSSQTH